jgi:hypothetical protein
MVDLSVPDLSRVCSLVVGQNDVLQTASFDGLETVEVTIHVFANPALVELSFGAVTKVGNSIIIGHEPSACPDYGNPSLATLAGFEALTDLNGNLLIWNDDALTSIETFAGLATAGSVSIFGNTALESLDGLSQLSGITYALEIDDDDSLFDLSGLESLAAVGGGTPDTSYVINIEGNDALTSISALGGMTSFHGRIELSENPALASLVGLESTETIESVWIDDNDSLVDLAGIDGLTSANSVTISANGSIASLAGLEGLETIGEELDIRDNTALQSLDGLENLATVQQQVLVKGNSLLPTCAATGLVDQLTATPDTSICIFDNLEDTCDDVLIPSESECANY